MRNIFETAQKMKNGTIKPAKIYNSIVRLYDITNEKLSVQVFW